MIAEELMIGDWVHLPSIMSDEVFPIQVYEILNDGVKYICGGKKMQVRYEQIQPIPLTVEILEKNGFFFDGTCRWEYNLGGGDKILVCPIQVDNEWWFADITGFEIYNGISDCLIEGVEQVYVHQLQNAMTLCKVNKKIEL